MLHFYFLSAHFVLSLKVNITLSYPLHSIFHLVSSCLCPLSNCFLSILSSVYVFPFCICHWKTSSTFNVTLAMPYWARKDLFFSLKCQGYHHFLTTSETSFFHYSGYNLCKIPLTCWRNSSTLPTVVLFLDPCLAKIQNRRMVGVERIIKDHPVPTPTVSRKAFPVSYCLREGEGTLTYL